MERLEGSDGSGGEGRANVEVPAKRWLGVKWGESSREGNFELGDSLRGESPELRRESAERGSLLWSRRGEEPLPNMTPLSPFLNSRFMLLYSIGNALFEPRCIMCRLRES